MLNDPSGERTDHAELYIDRKNDNLWISNNFHLEKAELSKNRFVTYAFDSLITDTNYHFQMYLGPGAQVLLDKNTLYSFEGRESKPYLARWNLLAPNEARSDYLFTDSIARQTWAVLGSAQLYVLDHKTKTIYRDTNNDIHHPLLEKHALDSLHNNIRFIMLDHQQHIWITTWSNMLFQYDPDKKIIKHYSLSQVKAKEEGLPFTNVVPLVNCMFEDDHHTLWVATEDAGLLRYDPVRDVFDYCVTREANTAGIRYDKRIYALYQDKEENIWIGTDQGISIFNPYRQYFQTISHDPANPLSLPKGELNAFIQTSTGDLLVGTWGSGFSVYDAGYHFKKTIAFTGGPRERNFIWSFMQVDSQTVWVGCQHGYLHIYNTKTGAVKTIHPPEMRNFTIRCMASDADGNIWFGMHSGRMVEWERSKGVFIEDNQMPPGSQGVRLAYVANVFFDAQHACWVGTRDGLKKFDTDRRIFTHTWLPDKSDSNAISGKSVQGIESVNDSSLVVGTIYGGMSLFNKRTEKFSSFLPPGSIPSNTVYAIKMDTAGFLWFTSDYGLYKFRKSDNRLIAFRMERGLVSASFQSYQFYPLQNGEWLTFTSSEAIRFFPNAIKAEQPIFPKVEITGFRIFDKPVFIDSLLIEHAPLKVSYKENFFSIEFAALNFFPAQQTNYLYRLNGIDHDWVRVSNRRFANYTDLPPGTYRFDVMAENGANRGGVTSLQIEITPPFWRTKWFLALSVVGLLLLIWWFVRFRIRSVRAIELEKGKVQQSIQQAKIDMYSLNEQLSKARMEALRSQMNPHFIFNCINSIDALIQSNDKYQATVYLNKFAKLIRNILDSSKQDTVTLAKDLDTLKLYIELEQLRHENKFTAEIIADESLLQDDFKIPPLVIQPFVENAILHGIRNRPDNNGKLKITVGLEKDQLRYVIEDNGVGRTLMNSHRPKDKISYGIDLSNERVKLFNGESDPSVKIIDLFANGQPAGTRVEVLLNI